MPTARPICRHVRLDGLVEYAACSELQRRLARQRMLGQIPDTLLLLEHSPVVTIGRSGSGAGLLVPAEALQVRGIATCETERGGKVTYHGPGQLVGYPILDLGGLRRDVHWYLRQLEEVLIRALADFGLSAERRDGLTGVWVSALPNARRSGKVAAIGVAVRRWVTMHGFALNVCCDLTPFSLIDPCGLADLGVTSMAEALGHSVSLDDVLDSIVGAFGQTFGLEMVRAAL
jgi:lipoate-protein ligase B